MVEPLLCKMAFVLAAGSNEIAHSSMGKMIESNNRMYNIRELDKKCKPLRKHARNANGFFSMVPPVGSKHSEKRYPKWMMD